MDTRRLPSDFQQWWTAFRHQFKFYLHTSRFLALLLLVVIATGAVIGVTIWRGDGLGTGVSYVAGFLGLFGLFGILIGAFMGGDALAIDFGGGTGYFTLVLPVRRSVLLLGRYVAAFVASAVLIAVFYGGVVLGSLYHYHSPSNIVPGIPLLESFLLALLYALGILSVAFFFSSFFRTPSVSIVATVLILIFGLNVADAIVDSLGYTAYYSINAAEAVLVTVLHAPAGPAATSSPITVVQGALIFFAYFVVFLTLSLIFYHFKESKG